MTLASPWRSQLAFSPHVEIATAPPGPRNDTGERKVRHAEVVMPYKGGHPTERLRRRISQGDPRGRARPLGRLRVRSPEERGIETPLLWCVFADFCRTAKVSRARKREIS